MRMTLRTGARIGVAAILGASALVWSGEMPTTGAWRFATSAEALIGRPLTPVSYAGVARRTTVRAAERPGMGYGGIGGPASGVGVLPGAGAGRIGVGPNLGGPVNRVGWR